MKAMTMATILSVAATMLLLAAAPASAEIVTWTCKARDLRGAHFTGWATGHPHDNVIRDRARDKALEDCAAHSVIKSSCVILDCTVN